jgi:hypothetical protein
MGGECSIYDRDKKCVKNYRELEKNEGISVKIWTRGSGICLWIGFIWLRTGAS